MAYMDNNFIASEEFLKTYEWRKLRQVVIEKYGNKCMCCGAIPANGTYLCVDHVLPRKKYPELAALRKQVAQLSNIVGQLNKTIKTKK